MAGVVRAGTAALLLGCVVLAGQAAAQTTPAPAPAPSQDEVTVTGHRAPTAEAPKSATCEALVRDPNIAAQIAASGGNAFMGPRFYLPTRVPRNPDYSKPPSVPPGSPLPVFGKGRFGVGEKVTTDPGASIDFSTLVEDVPTDMQSATTDTKSSTELAVDACRGYFQQGGGSIDGTNASADARFASGRAAIARNDTTLPMGFALFDQGRYAESLPWFKKAANKLPASDGGDEATLYVGKLYLQGLGAQSDPEEGVKWLKKTATAAFNPVTSTPQFNPRRPDRNTAIGEAAVILANIYKLGFGGFAKDPEESRKWSQRAWEVGHIPAAKMLGDLYYDGAGARRDVPKAVSYYKKAAKFDYPGAQVALAQILDEGDDGVAKDRKQAFAWYSRAARNGHPAGLYAVARAYDLGDGVPADPQRALGLYKAAALQGNAPARVAMGIYFYEGKLVPKDDKVARGWFEAAAKDGDSDGMVNLSAMLVRGEGGGKDMPGAWAWLIRAARRGNADAPRAVAALEKRMTPAEKQAGTALLKGAKGTR